MSERRRAVGFLGADDIACLLDLPGGVHVVAVRDDFMRNGVLVMLESEDFNPVPAECEPPRYVSPLLADPRRALASLRGWGPDFSDIDAQCPEDGCPWEYNWGDSVTLGEIARVVSEHLASAHPR